MPFLHEVVFFNKITLSDQKNIYTDFLLFLARKIPIPRSPASDRMVWLGEKSGNFSVNSAHWFDHHHKFFKLTHWQQRFDLNVESCVLWSGG